MKPKNFNKKISLDLYQYHCSPTYGYMYGEDDAELFKRIEINYEAEERIALLVINTISSSELMKDFDALISLAPADQVEAFSFLWQIYSKFCENDSKKKPLYFNETAAMLEVPDYRANFDAKVYLLFNHLPQDAKRNFYATLPSKDLKIFMQIFSDKISSFNEPTQLDALIDFYEQTRESLIGDASSFLRTLSRPGLFRTVLSAQSVWLKFTELCQAQLVVCLEHFDSSIVEFSIDNCLLLASEALRDRKHTQLYCEKIRALQQKIKLSGDIELHEVFTVLDKVRSP